jgi:hypothetical protein
LELPENIKIHPVVNSKYLKEYVDGAETFPYRPEYTAPPPPDVIQGEEHFFVEAFRKHKGVGDKLRFLVKWKGYPESENRLRPIKTLREDLDKKTLNKLITAYCKAANLKRADLGL